MGQLLALVVALLGWGLWGPGPDEHGVEDPEGRRLLHHDVSELVGDDARDEAAHGLPALGFSVSERVSGCATVARQVGDRLAVCVAVNVPQEHLNAPVGSLRILWHLADGSRVLGEPAGGGGPLVLFTSPEDDDVAFGDLRAFSVWVLDGSDWAR